MITIIFIVYPPLPPSSFSQLVMSVGVLFVVTMAICCLGIVAGGPSEEEQKRYVIFIELLCVLVYEILFSDHTQTDTPPIINKDEGVLPLLMDLPRGGRPLFITWTPIHMSSWFRKPQKDSCQWCCFSTRTIQLVASRSLSSFGI